MKKKYCTILYIAAILFLFSGCSVSKDKWINRQYHRIVSHYNAWWNGNQAYKEAQRTVDKNYKDDFTKIIPVYKFPNEDLSKTIKSNCDRGIEKGSKVIKKHSMKFNGKEKNPTVYEAYMLIGKSCLLQRDFKASESAFKLVINQWKNKPEMYEAMIYLALTYTKQGKYGESEIVLNQIQKAILDKKCPKKYKNRLNEVFAENNIAQGKYYPAVENINLRKKQFFADDIDVRLKFIKGQILMQQKDYTQAAKCFAYTYRHSGDFSMQFTSKLNQALCFDPNTANSIKIINDLEKLLDDPVNKKYTDQIYYAIGEVYYRNGSLQTACKKWENSVTSSQNNTTQKIASSLRAADVYFSSLKNYKKAQMYYDTALSLMGKDYPNRITIENRQSVLTNLVENLNIIERWDSLMAMSEMPEEVLNKKIDGWINDYKIEQKKKEEQAKIEQAIMQRNAQLNNFNQLNRNTSSFYFYNPSTVQSGKLEFERRWGKRALEDNWRLIQKEEIGFEDDDSTNSDNGTDSLSGSQHSQNSVTEYTPDKREYYTKDIPYSIGAKDTANEQTANALLEAGFIYWQGIPDKDKAIETFLDLHTRYPEHRNILPSSYHLYRIYDEKGDFPASNYYKNKILKEYPESEFAVMIQNPEIWADSKHNTDVSDSLYSVAYNYYANKEFLSAANSSRQAVETIKIGDYIPRLLYIEALSKGKIFGVDTLADNLNMIIFNYPNSEVTPVIEKQLQYLKNNYDIKDFDIKYDSMAENRRKDNSQIDLINLQEQDSVIENAINRDDILDAESLVFRYKDGVHYYVILADDSKNDANYIQDIIDTFNVNNFADLDLKTSANLFTSTYQLINVRKFKNMDEAFSYYDSLSADSTFKRLNPAFYKHFIISLQNYSTFYTRRNIDAYLKFFKIMYLNNRNEPVKKDD